MSGIDDDGLCFCYVIDLLRFTGSDAIAVAELAEFLRSDKSFDNELPAIAVIQLAGPVLEALSVGVTIQQCALGNADELFIAQALS